MNIKDKFAHENFLLEGYLKKQEKYYIIINYNMPYKSNARSLKKETQSQYL